MKEKELELERERLKLEKEKLKFEQYKQGLVERYEVKNNNTTNNKSIVLKQQKKKIIKYSAWKSMYFSLVFLFIISISFSLFLIWIAWNSRKETSNNSSTNTLVLSESASNLLLGSTFLFLFVNFILLILLGFWTFKKSDSKKIKISFFILPLIVTIFIIIFLPYQEKIFVNINKFNEWKNTFIILNSLNILIMLICLFFVAIFGNKELKKIKIQEKTEIDVNQYETELGSEIK